jgi:uncharacterized protein YecE (DUF72 family)
MTGTVFVGTSGWRYPRWRGDFYPRGLRQRDELSYLASRTTSAEINGSFYSLQRPSSYAAWRDAVPEGYVLAVKGGRYITHMKRLRDVATPLSNFLASGPLALGPSLGPFLWQLPERLSFDEVVVREFLELLPRTSRAAASRARKHDSRLSGDVVHTRPGPDRPLRHALEPRHPSWDTPAARTLLRDQDVAMVHADSAGRWPQMGGGTTDFHYVRLHGQDRLYHGGYSAESLRRWAGQLARWAEAGEDSYVYFDNDADGRAPWDATHLVDLLTELAGRA